MFECSTTIYRYFFPRKRTKISFLNRTSSQSELLKAGAVFSLKGNFSDSSFFNQLIECDHYIIDFDWHLKKAKSLGETGIISFLLKTEFRTYRGDGFGDKRCNKEVLETLEASNYENFDKALEIVSSNPCSKYFKTLVQSRHEFAQNLKNS